MNTLLCVGVGVPTLQKGRGGGGPHTAEGPWHFWTHSPARDTLEDVSTCMPGWTVQNTNQPIPDFPTAEIVEMTKYHVYLAILHHETYFQNLLPIWIRLHFWLTEISKSWGDTANSRSVVANPDLASQKPLEYLRIFQNHQKLTTKNGKIGFLPCDWYPTPTFPKSTADLDPSAF